MEVAQQIADGFAAQDFDAVRRNFDAGIEWHEDPSFPEAGVYRGIEAVGLWYQRRWAEYLTFIVTTLLIPLEIYELTASVSWFKVVELIVNLAIVVYLLVAKRLFGIRGGYAVELSERRHSTGWEALERSAPADPASAQVEGSR